MRYIFDWKELYSSNRICSDITIIIVFEFKLKIHLDYLKTKLQMSISTVTNF